MSIVELGALGEFLGSFGVILTLVYLGTQIRQNTRTVKAATYSETTNGWADYMQAQSVEDIQLLISLARKPGELTTENFFRGYYLCRVIFRRMEHDYYQYKANTFDGDTWNAYVTSWREDTFNNPAFRAMWKLQSDYLDPKFVQFMDDVVGESRRREPIRTRKTYEELLEAELRGG
jgi:hypothetical protein